MISVSVNVLLDVTGRQGSGERRGAQCRTGHSHQEPGAGITVIGLDEVTSLISHHVKHDSWLFAD